MATTRKSVSRVYPYVFIISILGLILCQISGFSQGDIKPLIKGPVQEIEVSSFDGNLIYQLSAYKIPTRSNQNIDIGLFYNSARANDDLGFGKGWMFSFGMQYRKVGDTVIIDRVDGQSHIFTWNGTAYNPPSGIHDVLTEYESEKFSLRTKYGLVYYFDDISHKKITSIKDRNNNIISFSYQSGKLTTITEPAGREIYLDWYNDHCSQIIDHNTNPDRTISFSYDSIGNLVMTTDPLGYMIHYNYGSVGNMSQIIYSDSTTISFGYNCNFAVESISCPVTNYSLSLSYDTILRQTTASSMVSSENRQTKYLYNYDGIISAITKPDNSVIHLGFDIDNNLISYINENGDSSIFSYDSKGNLLNSIDCQGNTEIHSYNQDFSLPLSNTDKNGNTLSNEYDANGNLITTIDAKGSQEHYTYNAYGNMLSYENKLGFLTSFIYNDNGDLINTTDPLGHTESYSYDSVGNEISLTDKNGNTWVKNYDLLNRPISWANPSGGIFSANYDSRGNLYCLTNELGKTAVFSYNGLNMISGETDPMGHTTTYSRDASANMLSKTDANGNTSTFTYNKMDQLITKTDPYGHSNTITYTLTGLAESETNKNSFTTTFLHDCNGRSISLIDPMGHSILYTNDAKGNVTEVTNKRGFSTYNTFDVNDNLTERTDAYGFTEHFTYDAMDNLSSYTEKNGNTTQYKYDEENRLILEISPSNDSIISTYDNNGNLLSQTDPEGHTTSNSYNEKGELNSTTTPLGFQTNYTYNEIGLMIKKQKPDNDSIHYLFNDATQMVNKQYSDGSEQIFTLDALGNVLETLKTGSISGTFVNTFDNANRLLSDGYTVNSISKSVGYTYDNEGNPLFISGASGNIHLAYNSLNNVITVMDQGGQITQFTYDSNSNVTGIQYPNGVITLIVYDRLDRPIQITTKNASNTILQSFQNTYDAKGNLTFEIREDGSSSSYTYNSRNLLISEVTTAPASQTTYTYNGDGLRTSKTVNGNTTLYTWNEDHLLQNAGSTSYNYNPNGCRTSMIIPGTGFYAYAYDHENMLVQNQQNTIVQNTVVSLFNDPSGRMVATNQTGFSRYYLHAGNECLEEYGPLGTILFQYTPGIATIGSSALNYSHYNGRGSSTMQTGILQNITATTHFDYFGNITHSSGSWANNYFQFKSLPNNNLLGLYQLPTADYLEPNSATTLCNIVGSNTYQPNFFFNPADYLKRLLEDIKKRSDKVMMDEPSFWEKVRRRIKNGTKPQTPKCEVEESEHDRLEREKKEIAEKERKKKEHDDDLEWRKKMEIRKKNLEKKKNGLRAQMGSASVDQLVQTQEYFDALEYGGIKEIKPHSNGRVLELGRQMDDIQKEIDYINKLLREPLK